MTCARIIATLHAAMIACILGGAAPAAAADEMSKEACVEAHSQGQDAREQGKLSLARKLFLTCAQSSCPALVQSDCARFADELERYQPSLSFAARDGRGNDLPDTSVYLDEALIATRLDDGRPREVDPGRHVVRFSHGGRDQVVAIVVGSGEKGRTIVGTFDLGPAAPASGASSEPSTASAPRRRRSLGPRLMLGAAAAVTATGIVLAVTGLVRVPSNCSLSSHDCAAPPGDKSLDEASKAVRLSNVGWSIGGIGAAALAGGLMWYAKDAKGERRERIVAPWFAPSAAGAQLRGRL